jgi:DNA polymerase-1
MDTTGWVFGKGSQSAKLMLIGEAPGKTESETGIPFSGPSGDLVNEMLEVAGISRSSVYITNVVKVRPPNNDLERLSELGCKVEDFLPLLWEEIEAVKPNAILALGSLALKTLTGKDGIRNYRGSILSYINGNIKVIPTIHPAALFERTYGQASNQGMFSWKQKIHVQFDFLRAAEECKSASFNLPNRSIRPCRTSLDFDRFLRSYYPNKGYDTVWVDCEVYKAHLVCCGLAFSPNEAISIPLIELKDGERFKNGVPMNEMIELWRSLAWVLANPLIKKVGQNFKGDKLYWLETAGFVINNFHHDGMLKFHTISPELPKGLAFQTSILTREPYYKFEGREYNPHRDKIDTLLHYNGMDCCVNCECDLAMDEDLKANNLESFFYDFVCKAAPIYESMEKNGLLVNKEQRDKLLIDYQLLFKTKDAELTELVGYQLNVNSHGLVKNLLFNELRLPRRVKADDDTLAGLIHLTKDVKKKAIVQLIRDIRSIRLVLGTYIKAHADPDGRMRFSYNQVGTETGRSSTGVIQSPARNAKWGVSIHALPKHGSFGSDARSMYIPDPGYVFMEFDQSQAEPRVVALLCNDDDLLNMFNSGIDVHRLTASYITGLDPSLIDDEQRQVGKMGRNGVNYRLQAKGLAIQANISPYRAQYAIDKISKMSPKIKEVFHEEIEHYLAQNNKVFISPFGRRREFFNKWGDELFREATAHLPQSTVGDNTKRAMITLSKYKGYGKWFFLSIEAHDAFVAQVLERDMEDFYWIGKEALEQPIDFEQCTLKRGLLTIPADCKVGYNYKNMTKWKP